MSFISLLLIQNGELIMDMDGRMAGWKEDTRLYMDVRLPANETTAELASVILKSFSY